TLVDATRGANGGYVLAKNPYDISIGEILRVLEDGLVIVDCLQGGCSNQCNCSTYDVWKKLYKEINSFLDTMSLGSIVEK
ncbi:MAG: Rrf2 family transcriptional regulator, partial [Clostridia bacterium]